jgi:hypothetical protein
MAAIGLGGCVTDKGWVELVNLASTRLSVKLFNVMNCNTRQGIFFVVVVVFVPHSKKNIPYPTHSPHRLPFTHFPPIFFFFFFFYHPFFFLKKTQKKQRKTPLPRHRPRKWKPRTRIWLNSLSLASLRL